ncbi:hypothetical protein [Lysinibacillus sp. ZYM-1]|uniref:hypothetical protein n=1 Tax=Lysinibacillus sp. ZYM-1 TaxID=1681184 RepID=UPI0006CE909A|nr:hypothetical protein [Lysinibacillus sp. ZYM-1]KPN96368.1 hypothetical protein AO843_17435 [Lysinibacillus sp. ZYM-1]
MRDSGFREHKREGHHRGGRHRGMEGASPRGAKTFRRGKAIAFLESLTIKRATIKQQLEQPEFQSIQQILVGELKAIDMVIQEFSQLFDIHESETIETEDNSQTEEGGNGHENHK